MDHHLRGNVMYVILYAYLSVIGNLSWFLMVFHVPKWIYDCIHGSKLYGCDWLLGLETSYWYSVKIIQQVFFFCLASLCTEMSLSVIIISFSQGDMVHNFLMFSSYNSHPSPFLDAKLSCVCFKISGLMCRLVIQRQNMKNMGQASAAQILFSRGCIKAKTNSLMMDAVSWWKKKNECLVILILNSPPGLSESLFGVAEVSVKYVYSVKKMHFQFLFPQFLLGSQFHVVNTVASRGPDGT